MKEQNTHMKHNNSVYSLHIYYIKKKFPKYGMTINLFFLHLY